MQNKPHILLLYMLVIGIVGLTVVLNPTENTTTTINKIQTLTTGQEDTTQQTRQETIPTTQGTTPDTEKNELPILDATQQTPTGAITFPNTPIRLAAITSCGVVTGSDTLTQNISSTGSCLNITGNNTVLDCAGYTIQFGNTSAGVGIHSYLAHNVTIKNCIIKTGSKQTGHIGIRLTGPTDGTDIINTTITVNTSGQSVGIRTEGALVDSNLTAPDNNIYRNISIYLAGNGSSNRGILLAGTNNNLNNITIVAEGTTDTVGALFNQSGVTANYSNGQIHVTGSGASAVLASAVFGGPSINVTNTILNTTTNWASSSTATINLTNVSYTTQHGTIRIKGSTILTTQTVTGTQLNITANKAFLNSTALPTYNQSSAITLNNLVGTNARPRVDFEDDATYTICPPTICTPTIYTSGTYTFDVTRFTSYRATETNLTLNATTAYNSTNDNLTAYLNATETFIVKNISDWREYNGSEMRSIAVVNLPFEGGSNTTYTRSYSAGEYNGTVFGPTWSATSGFDAYGSYSFDGINDNITVTNTAEMNTASFSVSLWLKPTTLATMGIYAKYGTTRGPRLFMNSAAGKLEFDAFPGEVGNIQTTSTISTGSWHHITITHDVDTGNMSIYVNGTLEASTIIVATTLNNTNTYSLALGELVGSFYLSGSIDDFKYYTRPLTPEQVSAIYQNKHNIIVAQETEVGDIWQACYTANNGTVDDATICSNNLTIVNNAPSIAQIILNTTTGTNSTSENLTATYINATDPDGEAFKNITDWRRYNGSEMKSIAVINLPFESGSNTTYTKGYSTSQYNGTVAGGATFSSTTGYDGFGAYSLDGVNDDITITNNAEMNTANFSVSLWLKPNQLKTMGAYSKNGASRGPRLFMANTAGKLEFDAFPGEIGNIQTASTISTGSWHHVVITHNAVTGNMSIYVNGTLENTTIAGSTLSNTNTFSLRVGSLAGSLYWNGSVDDFKYYTRPISAEQVKTLYENRETTLAYQETNTGERWQTCATPNDKITDGTTVCSNNISILGSCGDISTNRTLTTDHVATDTCFTITANNLVLDCAGYIVMYDTAGTGGDGLVATGRNNVTVKNCQFVDMNSGGSNGYGINYINTNNSVMLNNTIITDGTTANYGIYLETQANSNQIINNTISTQGTSDLNPGIVIATNSGQNKANGNTILTQGVTSNYGIYLATNASNNNLTNNTINTYGTSANYGIFIDSSSTNNNLTINTISTNGTSSANYGILVYNSSTQNKITQNSITTNGTSDNVGIRIETDNNNATYNIIAARGTTTANYGIYLVGTTSNRIEHNTINTSGTTTNYGILTATSSTTNTFNNNTIRTSGTDTNYGIYLNTQANSNTVTNNNITATGTGTGNRGIVIFSNAGQNIIQNNYITTNGGTTTNYGIQLTTNASNNNLTGNTISTYGTTTNYGILIDTSSLNNKINTNTISTNGTGLSNYGIYASSSSTGTNITSNSITTNGTGSDIGIRLSADDNYATYNTIYARGDTTSNIGIDVITGNRNYVAHNTINTTGTSSNIGIRTVTTSLNNTINNNTIGTSGSAGGNSGMSISAGSDGTNITNNTIRTFGAGTNNFGINVITSTNTKTDSNTIYTNGTSSGNQGIRIQTTTTNSTISNNTIYTDGTTTGHIGIILTTSVTGVNVTKNIIFTAGTGGDDGIQLDTNSNDNIVEYNNISTGTSGTNIGIDVATSQGNIVRHNSINTTGTSSNFGLRALTFTNNTLFYNNTIRTNGTAATNHGIHITADSTFNNVTNNTIYTNGLSDNIGVRIDTRSNDAIASGNTIYSAGIDDSNYGFYILTNVTRTTITGNTIITNGTVSNYGIRASTDINNTVISNNQIRTHGNSTTQVGILLSTRVYSSNLTGNNIVTNGTDASDGIQIDGNSNNNIAEYNNISTGTSGANRGIDLATSQNLIIRHNQVNTSGTSASNFGIRAASFVNNTIIHNNTIRTSGASTSNYGIHLATDVMFNNATNNTIYTSGTSSNMGIRLEVRANDNTLSGNTITTNGTGGSNYGFYLVTNSDRNNVTQNTIYTNGVGSNIGVRVHILSHNNRIIGNYIDTTGSTSSTNQGIRFENSTENNATGNTIFTGGTSSNYGLLLLTNATNSYFGYNNVTTSGTSSANSGLTAQAISNNNTIEYNIFKTSSTTSRAIHTLDSNNTYLNNTFNDTQSWIETNTATQNNFTNTTFLMPNGTIVLDQFQLNGTNVVNKTNLIISYNGAYIKTTEVPQLNVSGIVTLNNLTFLDPRPIADYEDNGTFTGCLSPTCVEVAYTGGNFTYTVTHFTNYSAGEGALLLTMQKSTINCSAIVSQGATSVTLYTCGDTASVGGIIECDLGGDDNSSVTIPTNSTTCDVSAANYGAFVLYNNGTNATLNASLINITIGNVTAPEVQIDHYIYDAVSAPGCSDPGCNNCPAPDTPACFTDIDPATNATISSVEECSHFRPAGAVCECVSIHVTDSELIRQLKQGQQITLEIEKTIASVAGNFSC